MYDAPVVGSVSDEARRAYYDREIERLRAAIAMSDAAINARCEAKTGLPAPNLFSPALRDDPIVAMMIQELEARRDGRA
jgi:hypothetical protein